MRAAPAAAAILLAGTILLGPAAGPARARTIPPRDAAEAAGAWILSQPGTARACGLTLGVETVGPEMMGPLRALRFPSGCRRAMPVLASAAGWVFEGGAIRLVGMDGLVFASFADPPGPDGALVARVAGGATLALTASREEPLPVEAVPTASPAPPSPSAPTPPTPAPIPGRPTVAAAGLPVAPPARPSPDGAPPGTYALDRLGERDLCRLALDAPSPAPAAAAAPGASLRSGAAAPPNPVRLLEGCRDSGIAVFDPAAWRYEGGRLTLLARRGHEVGLVPIGGGRWRRDPEIGAALVLRRVAP